jgi:hypothetical protein
MAIKVTPVLVADETNPVELTAWFTSNPSVVVNFITGDGRLFYIFHQ